MAARRNPFKPTFGVTPPVLAGREQALADFADALDEGPGAPGRATIYTGARGSGKTVLLNAAQDLAAARGWLVIAETATPGLVRRLVEEQLPALLAEHDPEGTQSRLTGITMPAALGRVDWTSSDRHAVTAGLRGQVTALCGILAKT
ncbi:MAG: ATP-binding protein, partial [Solirubrobacterales bacterium]|nr:ATP-binding protein [Solirubrobacterales bacterium]